MKIEVLDKGFVEYVDHMGSDRSIVTAARTSYSQDDKEFDDVKDKKLLSYLYKNSHSSPFEMAKIQFHIKMPLFVAVQYNRHRMQNLNYVSHRYTEPEEDFYIPSVWRKQSSHNKQVSDVVDDWEPYAVGSFPVTEKYNGHEAVSECFELQCHTALHMYKSMVKLGIGREMARMILPQNLYTRCYSCWDLNNLIKFLKLRDHPHAQFEIQEYARAMKEITRHYFPWTIEIFESHSG